MKYKLLTEEQILISIDRLTRFKETKQKYLRVFKDILVSNLIEPKLKKTEIEKRLSIFDENMYILQCAIQILLMRMSITVFTDEDFDFDEEDEDFFPDFED